MTNAEIREPSMKELLEGLCEDFVVLCGKMVDDSKKIRCCVLNNGDNDATSLDVENELIKLKATSESLLERIRSARFIPIEDFCEITSTIDNVLSLGQFMELHIDANRPILGGFFCEDIREKVTLVDSLVKSI